MNKKYIIQNSYQNTDNINDCFVFYLLYIILFFVVVFTIYKVTLNFKNNYENFDQNNKLSPEEVVNELKSKNNELLDIKNKLEKTLEHQSRATYITNNFEKIDETSFQNELNAINNDFYNTNFSSIDISKFDVINNINDYNNVVSEIHHFKNFYKPGDIVTSNSTFNINKNDICYRSNGKPINADPNFISNYPDCMVCSVENEQNLYNSNTWKDTKTNISKVCLFNKNTVPNSGIPNEEQCKQFCNI